MNSWIFVEGATAQKLLARVLEDLKPRYASRVVQGGGRDAVRPMARRQLLTKREPVALVVDSDTTNERRAKTQRRELEDYLAWGAAGTPFKVVQFIPEIEVVFFDCPSVLYRIVGKKIDTHAQEAGKLAPHRALAMLMPAYEKIAGIDKLRREDVGELRKHPVMVELRQFVEAAG